ncbi:MAG: hypothetical protein KJN77_03380 [Gammaproteobacteria bacterium]|nr:hypothetical protein [Gammaproteobacteria bacterium]
MRQKSIKFWLAPLALTLPVVAQAQHIPPIIAAFALSPVLVLLLAVVLGVVSKSLLVGLKHAGLVGIWILLFGVASYWVENDYVIWTPLALYVIHAVTMVILIARGVLRRAKG